MKNLSLKSYAIAFFALFVMFACENESVNNTTEEQETIAPNSTLVEVMQNASANDGSVDDVLDDANCISVNLPVTIQIDGLTITIETLDGLSQIEEIYNEFNDDVDDLDFVFPITIVLNDYTEIVINDEEELMDFVEACTNENPINECVDFQYPISFSLYNTNFQVTETVTIQSDFELYVFLEGLNDDSEGTVLASLNFPITMEYLNGNTVEVNSNEELQDVIEGASEFCGNVEEACSEEDVDAYLMECHWQVVAFNGDDNFLQYSIVFGGGGALQISGGDLTEVVLGEWSTSMSDDGVVLTLSELTSFAEDLGGDWLVVDCEEDRFELVRENENNSVEIVMERECDSNTEVCNQDEVRDNLIECHWYLGTNLYDNVIGEQFYFLNSNELLVVNPETNEENTGTWDIATIDGELTMFFNLNEPYGVISTDWVVIECDDDRVKMINGDDYLVFEQSCETSNPSECFSNTELVICDNMDPFNDGMAEFNLNEAFPNCMTDDVEVGFYQSMTNAEVQVNQIPAEGYVNTSNPQTLYARVTEVGTGNFEIYTVELVVEDCGQTCSEEQVDDFLMAEGCVWNVVNYNGSNDLMNFNLFFENLESVIIYNNETTIDAGWSTWQSENGVMLELSNVAGPNIQAISGEWLVVECEEDRLELYRDNDIMVLERACD